MDTTSSETTKRSGTRSGGQRCRKQRANTRCGRALPERRKPSHRNLVPAIQARLSSARGAHRNRPTPAEQPAHPCVGLLCMVSRHPRRLGGARSVEKDTSALSNRQRPQLPLRWALAPWSRCRKPSSTASGCSSLAILRTCRSTILLDQLPSLMSRITNAQSVIDLFEYWHRSRDRLRRTVCANAARASERHQCTARRAERLSRGDCNERVLDDRSRCVRAMPTAAAGGDRSKAPAERTSARTSARLALDFDHCFECGACGSDARGSIACQPTGQVHTIPAADSLGELMTQTLQERASTSTGLSLSGASRCAARSASVDEQRRATRERRTQRTIVDRTHGRHATPGVEHRTSRHLSGHHHQRQGSTHPHETTLLVGAPLGHSLRARSTRRSGRLRSARSHPKAA